MPPENLNLKTELTLIEEKETSELQDFLEAFFSPIATMAWTFLVIGILWAYCEIFVFGK